MNIIHKPTTLDTNHYFSSYIERVAENDLISALKQESLHLQAFANTIAKSQEDYCYQEGKWSVKQVFQHIIDTERILSYRSLVIARKDPKKLTGFDEESYAYFGNHEHLNLTQITEEFNAVRLSTIAMFQNMNEKVLDREHSANSMIVTPRMMGWMIAGHQIHHQQVLQKIYL